MKSMLDWLFVLGVNKIVIHGQFYSLDGHRKREAPPSIFWQAPYWPYFRRLSDHIQSTASILKQGRRHCEIAVLYPTAHINTMLPDRIEEAEAYRQKLGELCFELLSNQFDFDFVSEDDLLGCKPGRAGFRVGQASYRLLILPEVSMLERAVCTRLKRLASGDRPVLLLGKGPRVLEDGTPAALGIRRTPMARLLRCLGERIARPLELSGGNEVFCMTRQIGRARWHFLFNASPTEEYAGEAMVTDGRWLSDAGNGAALLPAARSGEPMLTIPALGSLLLKEVKTGPTRKPAVEPTDAVLHEWSVQPLAENVLVLQDWRVGSSERGTRQPLDLPNSYELPEAAKSAGVAWFGTTFEIGGMPGQVKLVWDEASITGTYEILVNGQAIGRIGRERIYDANNLAADITRYLQPGRRNHVKIKAQREGTRDPKLVEPIRVYGDFAVSSLGDGKRPPRITSAAWPMTVTQCGSWTDMGLPHYSGTVTYKAVVPLPDLRPRRAELRFGRVAEVARVAVNGEDCGVIAWPPWVCDVSKAVQAGKNEVVVEVANTSMNFIEGQPSESGLLGDVVLRLEG